MCFKLLFIIIFFNGESPSDLWERSLQSVPWWDFLIFSCVSFCPPTPLSRSTSCLVDAAAAWILGALLWVAAVSWLWEQPRAVGSERERAFFKLKQNKTKKEQSILVREKHLESFSLNKVLLWHLDAFIQVKKEFGTFPPRSAGLEEKKQIKRQDHLICCFVLFTWSVVPVDVGWVLLQPTEGLMEESYSVRSRAFFLMRKDNYHANLWSLFTRCI